MQHQPTPRHQHHMQVCQFLVYIFENWKNPSRKAFRGKKKHTFEKALNFFLLNGRFFSNFISAPAPAPYHAPTSYHAPAYHSAYSSGKCSAMHCIQLTLFHLFLWIFNKFRLFSGYNSRGYRSADYNAPILPPPGLFIYFFYLFLLIPIGTEKILQFFSLSNQTMFEII